MSLAAPGERSGAVEAVERILSREPEADRILRSAVDAVAERVAAARWVGIAFVEPEGLALGPAAGDVPSPVAPPAVREPVLYGGAAVAELWIGSDADADEADAAFLRRLAELLSPYCLVGWDTGGETWEYER